MRLCHDEAMWEPEPGWLRLPGSGPSTVGVWRAQERGRWLVVKRFEAPTTGDPGDVSQPENPAWWRRAAEVAQDGCVDGTAGLRSSPLIRVEEDSGGITLVTESVPDAGTSAL